MKSIHSKVWKKLIKSKVVTFNIFYNFNKENMTFEKFKDLIDYQIDINKLKV